MSFSRATTGVGSGITAQALPRWLRCLKHLWRMRRLRFTISRYGYVLHIRVGSSKDTEGTTIGTTRSAKGGGGLHLGAMAVNSLD